MRVQDVAQQIGGKDGESLRLRAAEGLSKVVRWRMLPGVLLAGVIVAVQLTISRIFSMLCGRRLRIPRALPGTGKGVKVNGIHLSRVALKRAQLVALVSFGKLWSQSKRAAIASVWMSVGVVFQALRMKKPAASVV